MILKKMLVRVFLFVFICSSLYGCGKSEEVKNVEALIDGIGEVTVDSEDSIKKAEEAYDALTDKEKGKVENVDQLEKSKEELAACIKKAEEEEKKRLEEERKAKIAPYVGTWKPIYADVLENEYIHQIDWVERDKERYNDIVIKEDDEKISVSGDNIFNVGGFTGALTLVEDNGIKKLVSSAGVFVREEDYDELMDKMFVHVTLDEDNISDYIGGPVKLGKYLDEWGDETDTDAYILSSPAYDNEGLIMLAFKDVKFEMYYSGISDATTYTEPYVLGYAIGSGTPTFSHFGRAEGEIWYVRKEYVSDIQEGKTRNINFGSYGFRRITFTDGFSREFYVPDTSSTNISVTDYEF